jgi:hypothetical protein
MHYAHWLVQGKAWRYQRGNQKPWIEEGQTIQWSNENDNQWSLK